MSVVMKLRDLLDNDQLLLVACHDCHAKTPLDPAPIALRFGVELRVAAMTEDLRCPSCGASDIALGVFSPIEKRVILVADPCDEAPVAGL